MTTHATVERRRAHRFAVENVNGVLTFSTVAKVLDVSLTGLAIESPERLRIGRTYTLTLRYDEAPGVPLQATAMWCQLRQRRDEEGRPTATWAAGLAIEGMLTEKAGDLVSFLRRAAVVSLETRICGRFRTAVPADADISSRYEFEVKTISLTGMLIVTELEAERGAAFDMEVELEDGTFETRGRVATVEQLRGRAMPRRYQLGIEFGPLTDHDQQRLAALIVARLAPQ